MEMLPENFFAIFREWGQVLNELVHCGGLGVSRCADECLVKVVVLVVAFKQVEGLRARHEVVLILVAGVLKGFTDSPSLELSRGGTTPTTSHLRCAEGAA